MIKLVITMLVQASLCVYLLVGGSVPVQASPQQDLGPFLLYLPLISKSIPLPIASTGAATSISTTTVTLNGTVNANNASTTVTFEYGLSTNYGSTVTGTPSPVIGTTNTNVSAAITGLTANKLYHFRVVAVNAGGTTDGSDVTFTTSAALATAISVGQFANCALTDAGGVKCWGYNYNGQLGDGSFTDSNTPVDVSGLTSGVLAIANGYKHTCALTSQHGVKCWGYNADGELGDGTTTTTGPRYGKNAPVDVYGLTSGVDGISAYGYHTCAVMNSGTPLCWGFNYFGELGDGTKNSSNKPVAVSGLANSVNVIKAGENHTCALLKSGGVKCWGDNQYGQLGDGTTNSSNKPVNTYGLASGVNALTSGAFHSCILQSGKPKCWGRNDFGQLGDNSTNDRNKPVEVSGLTSGVQAISGGFRHTCALLNTGGARCWGNNGFGQLGDGTASDHHVPVNVSGLSSGLNSVRSGYRSTCARTTTSGVRCWGDNSFGELGNGTYDNSLVPVSVVGFP